MCTRCRTAAPANCLKGWISSCRVNSFADLVGEGLTVGFECGFGPVGDVQDVRYARNDLVADADFRKGRAGVLETKADQARHIHLAADGGDLLPADDRKLLVQLHAVLRLRPEMDLVAVVMRARFRGGRKPWPLIR